jgi:hypothetical protein
MLGRDDIVEAVERRRNAMKALDDAITELQVATRLLDDLTIGSCPGAFTRPGRVAAGPAGGSLSIPAGPDDDVIQELLKIDVEQLARLLFPEARRQGNYLVIGSVRGERGRSMKIGIGHFHGRGVWRDYAVWKGDYGWGGDCLDLIAAFYSTNREGARRWARDFLRLDRLL